MFNKHLKDHWISYRDHQKLAFFFARESFKASLMAFIHWWIPNLFQTGASDLHKNIFPEYDKLYKKIKDKYK